LGAYFEVEKTTGSRFWVPPSLACVWCFSWFRIRITSLAIWLRLGRTVFRGAIFGQGDLADDRAGCCLDGRRLGRACECEWTAIVGFISVPLPWAIFGHASFLEFFDIRLLGDRREALLEPNASFHAQRTTDNEPLTTSLLPACPKTRVTPQVAALRRAKPTKMHPPGTCSALDDRPRSRRLVRFHAWPLLLTACSAMQRSHEMTSRMRP